MMELAKIKTISEQLLTDIPKEGNIVAEYLLTLASLKGFINEVIVDVNYLYNNELANKTESLMKQYPELATNSSGWKNLLKGAMKDYQRVIDLADRVRSTINTHCQNCISYLSYLKSER